MSVYIKGMEMPKDGAMIFAIRPDGMIEDVMGRYIGKAMPVPEHGRLIDADELPVSTAVPLDGKPYKYVNIDNISAAPTIIPADQKKEKTE